MQYTLVVVLSLFLSIGAVKGEQVRWVELLKQEKLKYNQKFSQSERFVTGRLDASKRSIPFFTKVEDWDYLSITITDAGDGNSYDQSVLASAYLISQQGDTVWLDQLKPLVEKPGYGVVKRNQNVHGKAINVDNKRHHHGLAIHAPGSILFPLNKKYKEFHSILAIDDASKRNGSVEFIISSASTEESISKLVNRFGHQLRLLTSNPHALMSEWLESTDNEPLELALHKKISELKYPIDFQALYQKMVHSRSTNTRSILFGQLLEHITEVLLMEQRLATFDPIAVKLAYEDMCKELSYPRLSDPTIINQLEDRFKEQYQLMYKGEGDAIDSLNSILTFTRSILLDNPLLKDKKLMLTQRKLGEKARVAMSGALGVAPTNFQNNSEIYAPRSNWNNQFISLTLNGDGNWREELVYKPASGTIISDPEVHFDGKRVLYSSIGANDRWHLFELNLSTGETRQVTPDSYRDFDSFDGCYTPDGRIIFCSTATFLGLPCTNGKNKMCGLFIYDPKTGETRQLTFDQDSNWDPVVMNNGQIMYQRWEYADLPHSNSRIMFRMNPDGTSQQALYGSNSYFPTALFSARPLPGVGTSFVGVVSGHHSMSRSGRLMTFDPMIGVHEADGVVAEIPHRGRKVEPIVRDRLPDGVWPQFLHPYPLNENYFLVSMKHSPHALWGVYLVDVFNNMTLLCEKEEYAMLEPTLLQERVVPPVIPDRIVQGEKEATIYLQDVYFGDGLKDIPRGTVKKLRVGSYHFSPVSQGGLLGAIGMDGPWDIKRILGTVDVEEDGSAIFKVPANVPIFIQPLDEEGKALQVMRSWFTAMPGEVLSCLGCHEDPRSIPHTKSRLASSKLPQSIKPWYGRERGFSFAHEIQPILDRKCITCHNDERSDLPYLKGDRMEKGWSSQIGGRAGADHGGRFTTSYVNLHRYVRRPGIESDMNMLTPMDVHADQTELMRILNKGHHGVTLSDEEIEKIACWVDFNAPYHGSRTTIPNYEKSKKWRELKELYAEMLGAPIEDYHYLPPIEKVEPQHPVMMKFRKGKEKLKGWPFKGAEHKIEKRTISIDEKYTLDLVRIPQGQFIMGSDRHLDEMPQTIVKIKEDYWMAQFEITNELYALFDPSHDSRHEHRHGYQFGRIGYPLNMPQQPVVRISWEQAMAFCAWLTDKTGMRFSLPTEAQWEWACRAGSNHPYYFGKEGSDFSTFANLGDIRLKEFAACTSHKFYESVRILSNPNKYDDWIPRDTTYDDGGFVSEEVGKYRPNAWGLYDMIGNVAEWTRSSYVSYPYKEKDGRNNRGSESLKVTRGGSWYDRPLKATASFRQPYRSYQKVYNVGFRVVMTE